MGDLLLPEHLPAGGGGGWWCSELNPHQGCKASGPWDPSSQPGPKDGCTGGHGTSDGDSRDGKDGGEKGEQEPGAGAEPPPAVLMAGQGC